MLVSLQNPKRHIPFFTLDSHLAFNTPETKIMSIPIVSKTKTHVNEDYVIHKLFLYPFRAIEKWLIDKHE
jgi:hypothetical protein